MILAYLSPSNDIVFASNKSLEEVRDILSPISAPELRIVEYKGKATPPLGECYNFVYQDPTFYYYSATRRNPKSMLVYAQCRALERLSSVVGSKRAAVTKYLLLQSEVYLRKVQEAQRLQSGLEGPFPYVAQYASLEGIGLEEAANRILEKYRQAEEVAYETEGLRLSYVRIITQAPDYTAAMKVLAEVENLYT